MRDQQARRGGHEGGEGAGGDDARPGARRAGPATPPAGTVSTTASVCARHVQLRRERAAEQAVDCREEVEEPEQAEHAHGRAPRRRAVGVGVEAHEDVRQAHRAQERRQQQRVHEEGRGVAADATGRAQSIPRWAVDPAARRGAPRRRRSAPRPHGSVRCSPRGRCRCVAELSCRSTRRGTAPASARCSATVEAARTGAGIGVAEQRRARGQPAEVDHDQHGGDGDRRRA